MIVLQAGKSIRAVCPNCNHGYKLMLEPGAKDMKKEERPSDEAKPLFCPFCGAEEQKYEEQ